MLISKRSRRTSEQFSSRFRDGQGVEFPLRQYLRCREDFATTMVHAALLAAFLVTVLLFGRTLDRLFDVHGAHLNPWYKRGAFLLWGFFALSVLRRLCYKVLSLREIRREMGELKAVFRDRDAGDSPDA
ncbi:MAG TPA: hypothetical protein PLQ13_02875 [Candidatus Krumholzibacteria bacterium]|nr:hypothetical protein [Candidatus Krumholzibacteria bacterium]